MKINKIILAVGTFATIALLAIPVFATQNSRAVDRQQKTERRIANVQTRDAKMIDNRIANLNQLLTRISQMKNLSDAQKSPFTSTIQTEITNLTGLKSQISTDTATTSLKADTKSITRAYRIYALVEPQIRIIAAADRTITIVNMMNAVGTKIQSRLAADTTANANATVQSSLSDFAAKLTDASTQAQGAASEVAALQPDNGDKTVFQSNIATLKDARSKIRTAHKDLVAARKDILAIVKVLIQNLKATTKMEAGTATTTP